MPPAHQRHPKARKTPCGIAGPLVLGDGESVRKKARREYDLARRKLDQARQELNRFNTEDSPAFHGWLNRTFGALLTALRELNHRHLEKAQLIQEVEMVSFAEGVPHSEAYRLVQHRRAHPEAAPPPPKIDGQAAESAAPEFDRDDLPPEEEPWGRPEDAAFNKAFADFANFFGVPLPPGMPGSGANPAESPRVKELYRTLVRKLHPDSQGQLTPEKREWWHEVQEAYAEGDAARLEQILTLCAMQDGSAAKLTSVSLLRRLTGQCKVSLRAVKDELQDCRHAPAWNFNRCPDRTLLTQRIQADLEGERQHLHQMIAVAGDLLRRWEDEAARAPRGGSRRKSRGKPRGRTGDQPFLF